MENAKSINFDDFVIECENEIEVISSDEVEVIEIPDHKEEIVKKDKTKIKRKIPYERKQRKKALRHTRVNDVTKESKQSKLANFFAPKLQESKQISEIKTKKNKQTNKIENRENSHSFPASSRRSTLNGKLLQEANGSKEDHKLEEKMLHKTSPKKLRTTSARSSRIEKSKNLNKRNQKRNFSTNNSNLNKPVSIWSVKHQPKNSDEIVGNQDSVKTLYSTLSYWKKRLLKDGKNLESNKIEDDDFVALSDGNYSSDEISKSVPNVCVLSGGFGCGKTSSIHACAKQLGFKVLEINASDVREAKKIMTILQEASQSHNVGKNSMFQRANELHFPDLQPTKKQKSNTTIDLSPKSYLDSMSLVLFDEMDAVLPPDKSFWNAVRWFMKSSKTPVLITTTDISFLPDLGCELTCLHMFPPSPKDIESLLNKIVNKERDPQRTIQVNYEDLITCSRLNDVRSLIMTSQFWYQQIEVDEVAKTPLNVLRRLKTSEDLINSKDPLHNHLNHVMSHQLTNGFCCIPKTTETLSSINLKDMLEMSMMNSEEDIHQSIFENCYKFQKLTSLHDVRRTTGSVYDGVGDEDANCKDHPLSYDQLKLFYEIRSHLQILTISSLHKKTSSFPISCLDEDIFTGRSRCRESLESSDKMRLFDSRSYHLDFYSYLLSICESEKERKLKNNNRRRFYHYLQRFLSPAEIFRFSLKRF